MFARDIAKSFLRAVLDPRDLRSLGGLDHEIEWGGTFAVPILTRAPGPARLPPSSPTPAYRVFLGRDERFERVLHKMRLCIEKLSDSFPELLRIGVAPAG